MDSSRRALICSIIYSTAVLYVAGEEVIRLQELEGNTVTIHTGVTGVQTDAKIYWFYRSENVDIMIVDSLVFKGETNTDYDRDRFRDRLQLNRNSGSLTIRNISREDSGVYILHIITGHHPVWSFSVDVYAMVSSPYITRHVHDPSASASAPGSRCSVLCSAESQREMTLSWFKRRDILSQTRDSDLSVNLTLPLEVSDEDQDTYSCVTTNPVSNRSITLNIKEICSPGTGDVQRWGLVEFVIRSAFCVVVLVALIAVLVHHFKTL